MNKKPKFKVGDIVVYHCIADGNILYMQIYNMSYQNKKWLYNILPTGGYWQESDLRIPAENELKYFSK